MSYTAESRYESIDAIFHALKTLDGGTPGEIATHLGCKRETTNARLSKLASYGRIERDVIPRSRPTAYRYRLKVCPS